MSESAPARCAETPATWRRVRLGDVCRIVAPHVDPKLPEFRDLPHVSGENIESATGELLEVRSAADDGMTSTKYLFGPGDLLYSKLRPYLRKAVLVDFKGLCSADMYPIQVNRAAVDPEFLKWLLLAGEFSTYADNESRRARMPKLNRQQLLSWEAPLPPLPEQKRIAAALREQLDAAARLRAAAGIQVAVAERLVESELLEAFRGIIPLAVGSVRDTSPDGWKWRLLSDLARLESGHTPSRRHPEWWGGGIPWLALPDIRDLDCQVAHETAETTNELGIANSSARVLPEGTVVLSRTASVGFVAMMGRPMATSQDFVNWVCGPELDPTFLMYLLRASRGYIRQLSSGAIHKTVYVPTVKAFAVCVPGVDEQKRVAAKVRSRLVAVDEIRAHLESQAAEMGRLPAAHLRAAFSGEL